MGILDKRINPKSEKYIQNQVINNKSLQKYIIDSLNIKYEDSIKFSKGLTYDNRILPDIKISKGDEVLALMECKGANINVTDYVRGIGQLFQYEDFFERNTHPWHHHRPGLNTSKPVNPFFGNQAFCDVLKSKLSSFFRSSTHRYSPGVNRQIACIISRITFVRTKLVKIIVRGDNFFRGYGIVFLEP